MFSRQTMRKVVGEATCINYLVTVSPGQNSRQDEIGILVPLKIVDIKYLL